VVLSGKFLYAIIVIAGYKKKTDFIDQVSRSDLEPVPDLSVPYRTCIKSTMFYIIKSEFLFSQAASSA
jgi:hypothetical protein